MANDFHLVHQGITGRDNVGILVGKTVGDVKLNRIHAGTFIIRPVSRVYGREAVGGIVGEMTGKLENSESNTAVIGVDENESKKIGGAVGYLSSGSIARTGARGHVYSAITDAGGLVGYAKGNIGASFAGGNAQGFIQGNNGGLVGTADGIVITNAFARGKVAKDLGKGFVGLPANGTIASNTFWDVDNSGTSVDTLATGKSHAEMGIPDTFTGYDYQGTWEQTENASYPGLIVIPPPMDLNYTALEYLVKFKIYRPTNLLPPNDRGEQINDRSVMVDWVPTFEPVFIEAGKTVAWEVITPEGWYVSMSSTINDDGYLEGQAVWGDKVSVRTSLGHSFQKVGDLWLPGGDIVYDEKWVVYNWHTAVDSAAFNDPKLYWSDAPTTVVAWNLNDLPYSLRYTPGRYVYIAPGKAHEYLIADGDYMYRGSFTGSQFDRDFELVLKYFSYVYGEGTNGIIMQEAFPQPYPAPKTSDGTVAESADKVSVRASTGKYNLKTEDGFLQTDIIPYDEKWVISNWHTRKNITDDNEATVVTGYGEDLKIEGFRNSLPITLTKTDWTDINEDITINLLDYMNYLQTPIEFYSDDADIEAALPNMKIQMSGTDLYGNDVSMQQPDGTSLFNWTGLFETDEAPMKITGYESSYSISTRESTLTVKAGELSRIEILPYFEGLATHEPAFYSWVLQNRAAGVSYKNIPWVSIADSSNKGAVSMRAPLMYTASRSNEFLIAANISTGMGWVSPEKDSDGHYTGYHWSADKVTSESGYTENRPSLSTKTDNVLAVDGNYYDRYRMGTNKYNQRMSNHQKTFHNNGLWWGKLGTFIYEGSNRNTMYGVSLTDDAVYSLGQPWTTTSTCFYILPNDNILLCNYETIREYSYDTATKTWTLVNTWSSAYETSYYPTNAVPEPSNPNIMYCLGEGSKKIIKIDYENKTSEVIANLTSASGNLLKLILLPSGELLTGNTDSWLVNPITKEVTQLPLPFACLSTNYSDEYGLIAVPYNSTSNQLAYMRPPEDLVIPKASMWTSLFHTNIVKTKSNW
jgi:hypothetical protein